MNKILRRSLVVVILFLGCLITGGVKAATFEVGPSGYPYTSIQVAINDADPGDTVLVHDGTYTENISFSGKVITVKSVNGAANTIIDGDASGSVVTFNTGEGSGTVLDGFAITNGHGFIIGGGIYCYFSSPTITNCTISRNYNGGISCTASSPTIANCTISRNSSESFGPGIYCYSNSSATITTCTITENSGPEGGGICCDRASPTITNCTISRNSATWGGGIYSYVSSPSVKNTILWGNVPDQINSGGSPITVTYSDVDQSGYAGSNGNIRQDPIFVDLANSDFHLQPTSPCIDAATSDNAPLTDMKGNSRFDAPLIPNTGGGAYPYYDMGAYEYGIPCAGDFDGDGDVDSSDLAVFATNFGKTDCYKK